MTPDDVRAMVHDVLRHRLILSYEANAAGITPNQVIDELTKNATVPGFRQGHAPRALVEKRFRKDLDEQAVLAMLNSSSRPLR